MYEYKNNKINIDWKSLIIKMVILLLAVFIVIWLISLVNGRNKKTVESNIGVNLQAMKEAGIDYFKGSKLPTTINGKKKITLGEMFDSKLLVEFKDQNNNSCDEDNSYVEATKINSTDYTIKVKLVCGQESDYIVDTVAYEIPTEPIENPTEPDDSTLVDNNENNNNDNNNNNNQVVNNNNQNTYRPNTTNNGSNNSNTSNKTNVTYVYTNNNNNGNNNNNNNNNATQTQTCTYGVKDYNTAYPIAYIIPGNCAVSKDDYYKAEYMNKANTVMANEYKKLYDEISTLSAKTGAQLYIDTNTNGVYNKTNTGLVGYQMIFTVKQRVNYAVSTVYEYYLDSYGNRKVITDKRSSITNQNNNNNNNQNNNIAVTGISLNKSSVSLYVGETTTVSATVTPSNATNKTVTWRTNNSNIATVDNNGKITANKAGIVIITATAGNVSKSITVTVNDKTVAVTNLSLSNTSVNLYVGDTTTINATVTPSNATNKTVTWRSENTSVATVDNNGKITANKAGTTNIIATVGNINKYVKVTVSEKTIPVNYISLNKTSITLYTGDSSAIMANVSPYNATNKTITWTSSNPNIVTIDNLGRVTGLRKGTATVTARIDNVTASAIVTVLEETTYKYCKVNTERVYSTGFIGKNTWGSARTYSINPYQIELQTSNTNFYALRYGTLSTANEYQEAYTYWLNKNGKLTMVGSNNSGKGIDAGSYTNLMNSSLKAYNFEPNVSYAGRSNRGLIFNVSMNLKNLNNISNAREFYTSSNSSGYFLNFYFDIAAIDYNNCRNINESEVNTYIRNGYIAV